PQNASMNANKPLPRRRYAQLIAAQLLVVASACSGHAAPPGASDPKPAAGADTTGAIASLAAATAPHLIELRRDLHRHPELAEHETRTSALVAQHLEALGLEVRRNVGGHGVVGVLRGKRPGAVVAYRADMDAFRGDEPARPYASTVPGV